MKKPLFPLFLSLLLLAGCASAPPAAETAAPTESVVMETVPETTVPVTEATQPPVVMAAEISQPLFLQTGKDVTASLTDGSYTTQSSADALQIESPEPFCALYLEWAQLPQSVSLQWDGGSLEAGTEFLHQYLSFPGSVTSLTLTADAGLCNVRLFTEGTPPEDVQLWQPPAETADILVVATHSDDDVLFFGAVMAYYATETDYRIQTAFMVNHYYEPVRDHERLNGLWTLGIRHYPVVGDARDYYVTDLYQAKAKYFSDDIPGWQVELLRRFRPSVVLGHDLNGEYGHGAHRLNALSLTQAVELAADGAQYPESAQAYGTWDTPKLYLHLYEENQLLFDVDTPLSGDALGRTPFQVAQAAYACHESQQTTDFRVSREDFPSLDCRRFGLYRSLVGQDTGWDLMEHISD